MLEKPFVPADFAVPDGLTTEEFRLEPLGPQHNASDYAAWSSSIGHILATPGFGSRWPYEMTLDDNRLDLERHAADFANRVGFTYTVLAPEGDEVIGCVYIYPSDDGAHDTRVRSWVRVDRAVSTCHFGVPSASGSAPHGPSLESIMTPGHSGPMNPGGTWSLISSRRTIDQLRSAP